MDAKTKDSVSVEIEKSESSESRVHDIKCGPKCCREHVLTRWLPYLCENKMFTSLFRDPLDPLYWIRVLFFDIISLISSLLTILESRSAIPTAIAAIVFIALSWIVVFRLMRAAVRTKFGRNKLRRLANVLCCRSCSTPSSSSSSEDEPKERHDELKHFHEEFSKHFSMSLGSLSSLSSSSPTPPPPPTSPRKKQEENTVIKTESTRDFKMQKLRVNHYQHKFMGSILVWLVLHLIVSISLVLSSLLQLREDYFSGEGRGNRITSEDIPWYVQVQTFYSVLPLCLAMNSVMEKANELSTNRCCLVCMNRIIEWIVTIVTLLLLWFFLVITFYLSSDRERYRRVEGFIVLTFVLVLVDLLAFLPFVFFQHFCLRLFGYRTHSWGKHKGRFF